MMDSPANLRRPSVINPLGDGEVTLFSLPGRTATDDVTPPEKPLKERVGGRFESSCQEWRKSRRAGRDWCRIDLPWRDPRYKVLAFTPPRLVPSADGVAELKVNVTDLQSLREI
jgi:hypothetical protein